MRLGICTDCANAPLAREQGWEFVEEAVYRLLEGTVDDANWKGEERARASALPIPSANVLVPGNLKITGPDANLETLRSYMTRVLTRAAKVGIRTLVFGSGGARAVPEGFDRDIARGQIIRFLQMSAPIAQANGVTIVVEHLQRGETNIINSLAEAMSYTWAVNHPAVRCLVDSYHFWTENESLDDLRNAMPLIRHVHVADKAGRVAPGLGGGDYRPFFAVLKRGGYDGDIAVESPSFDLAKDGPAVLELLKTQWREA